MVKDLQGREWVLPLTGAQARAIIGRALDEERISWDEYARRDKHIRRIERERHWSKRHNALAVWVGDLVRE